MSKVKQKTLFDDCNYGRDVNYNDKPVDAMDLALLQIVYHNLFLNSGSQFFKELYHELTYKLDHLSKDEVKTLAYSRDLLEDTESRQAARNKLRKKAEVYSIVKRRRF